MEINTYMTKILAKLNSTIDTKTPPRCEIISSFCRMDTITIQLTGERFRNDKVCDVSYPFLFRFSFICAARFFRNLQRSKETGGGGKRLFRTHERKTEKISNALSIKALTTQSEKKMSNRV